MLLFRFVLWWFFWAVIDGALVFAFHSGAIAEMSAEATLLLGLAAIAMAGVAATVSVGPPRNRCECS